MVATVEFEPKIRPLNVSEYLKMAEVGILEEDEEIELIQGEIIKMSPTGFFHSSIVDYLNYAFQQAVIGQAIVRVQSSIWLNDKTMPEPDLAIVKYRSDFYRKNYVKADDILLVIEVSDTTLHYDKNTKTALYASFNIPEMWVIDVKKQSLIRYANPIDGIYKNVVVIEKLTTLPLIALKNIEIDLSHLF